MSDSIDRQKVLATLDFADNALDEERTVEKYKELLAECVKALPSAENKGEWIPVSERLPEDDTEVVYCTERGTVGSCHYFEGFNHYKGCSRKDIFDDIVAWIPIPEPYKKVREYEYTN